MATRRGTAIAAYALGFSLVATSVQGVLPQSAQVAHAQIVEDAGRTDVTYAPLVVDATATATQAPELAAKWWAAKGVGTPKRWELQPDFVAPAGWDVQLDEGSGQLRARMTSEFAPGAPESFEVPVVVTFADDSVKRDVVAQVQLTDATVVVPQLDRTLWEGKATAPWRVLVVHAPADVRLEATGLPKGMKLVPGGWLNTSVAYFLVFGTPEESGEFPVVVAQGQARQEFVLTVRSAQELPAPVPAPLVEHPQAPVEVGQELDIDVDTQGAASVEVAGLPEGTRFDAERSKIVGAPSGPGVSEVTVDVITESGEVKRDQFTIEVAGDTSEPGEPEPEEPAPPAAPDDFAWAAITVRAGEEASVTPQRSVQGVTVEAVDAPSWVNVFPNGSMYLAPGADVAPGSYRVRVRTSKGEEDAVAVTVTAAASLSERYDASYTPAFIRAGSEAVSAAPNATLVLNGMSFARQPLPAATKFALGDGHDPRASIDGHTGVVTLAVGLDEPVGSVIEVPVTASYDDGTTDQLSAVFEVLAPQFAQTQQPVYESRSAYPGQKVTVRQTAQLHRAADPEFSLATPYAKWGGWDVFVNPASGDIEATAPRENARPLELEVTVRYADGSVATVPATIGVEAAPPQALTSPLDYGDVEVGPDGTVTLTPNGPVPPGVTFAPAGAASLGGVAGVRVDVDKETGVVRISVPRDAKPGEAYDVGVAIQFPDGGVKHVSAKVETPSIARRAEVSWAPITLAAGGDTPAHTPRIAPADATYAIAASYRADGWATAIDSETGAITVVPPATAVVGDRTVIPVVVTFSDGSQKEVNVTAEVVTALAGRAAVVYNPVTVRAGDSTAIAPNVQAKRYSLVAEVPGLDTTIDATSGLLRVSTTANMAPGLHRVPVQVTYADGTSESVAAEVRILTATGAPTLADATPALGAVPVYTGQPNRYVIPRPPGATEAPFSITAPPELANWRLELDATTGALRVTPPAGAAGRTVNLPVTINFVDGSQATQTLALNVEAPVERGSSVNGWSLAAIVIGLLAFIGGTGYALFQHHDFFQQFLAISTQR